MTKNAFKMQVKTRHGHKKGALGVLEGQICPEKGPKGPFSVKFGSLLALGLEKGSKLAKACSKGPKRPQRGSKWPQNGVKIALFLYMTESH